jgi:hypothetical protein
VAIVSMGLSAGITVMAECHTLTRRDRCHALQRNCESEQHGSKNTEEGAKH